MAECVDMSLSQLFRAKGGYVRHNMEDLVVRLELKVGSKTFVGRTGADLKAFRYLEGLMQSKLLGGLVGVEHTSKSVMGIDMSFLRRLKVDGSFEDRVKALQDLIAEQRKSYDAKGFIVSREIRRGTFENYFKGEELDVLVCENQLAKKRMAKALADEDGEWRDLEFHFSQEEKVPPVTDCDYIIEEWLATEYICEESRNAEEDGVFEKVDWNDIVEGDDENLKAEIPKEIVNLFLAKLKEPISSYQESQRNKIFWGGGKAPGSEGKKERLIKQTFPADKRMPLQQFMAVVKKNLVEVWGFEENRNDMGEVNLDLLVVGQMLRARSHLHIHHSSRTVEYVPRPEAYIASQRKQRE